MLEKPAYGVSGTPSAYVPQLPETMPAKKTTKKVAAKKVAVKSPVVKKAVAKKAPVKKPVTKAPTKTVAKKASAKVAEKAPVKAARKAAPSLDAIAKAAYLNYRRRADQGLPGDNDSDWLEAERSLHKS